MTPHALCEDCRTALTREHGAYFTACDSCFCRLLADSRVVYEAEQQGAVSGQLAASLKARFGDKWKESIEQVKAWRATIKARREAKDNK